MTDYVIPCETFLRLSRVLTDFYPAGPERFDVIRYDNGQVIATNRRVMSVENIGGPSGIIHIIADKALLKQCEVEAGLGGKITVTYNELLKYGVAKTTFGYIHPGNCVFSFNGENEFDRWRSVTMRAATPASKPWGGMFWDADNIARLAATSPSGKVVFEEMIDCTRPTIMRDVTDYNWLGVFNPFADPGIHTAKDAAKMPDWMTA